MWNKPWKIGEGTAIAAGLTLVGVMLQLSVGPLDWDIFLWPANIVALALLVLLLVVAYVLRQRVYFFRFMTSMAAAVPAIAFAVVLTIIMGVTRQVGEGTAPQDPLGLTKMLSCWPFILVYVWMTMIVGEVAIHQLAHLSRRSLPVFVSHLGLFIALTCATLGSADMQRVKMYCEKDKPEWRGLDSYKNVHELPLAIELKRFTIEEYPPKLLVIDRAGRPLPMGKGDMLSLDDGVRQGTLLGTYAVTVKQSLKNGVPRTLLKMVDAMPDGMMRMVRMDSLGMAVNRGGYVKKATPGAAPTVYVAVRRTADAATATATPASDSKQPSHWAGWVTCGSYQFPYQGLPLDQGRTLVMGNPEPQRYLSDVLVYTPDGRTQQASISVNHPLTVNGWKVYQLSYNEEMGRWSTLSVFELVRDPWLPVVYLGIFLLMLGAIGMFLTASTTHSNKKDDHQR